MGDTIWLALQALGTMVIVIGLAYVSWRQTQRLLARRQPRKPSAMARATPDPQFQPDAEVTDPFHVMGALHAPGAGDRPEASGTREREQMIDRAHAASVEHPSAVEQLDGTVGPTDEVRQDGVASDATVRLREAR